MEAVCLRKGRKPVAKASVTTVATLMTTANGELHCWEEWPKSVYGKYTSYLPESELLELMQITAKL